MAYLVARRDGRYEIRESETTGAGPRSRTLVTLRTLSDADLDRAEQRARRGFDRRRIEARARVLGVPRLGPTASRRARQLLGEVAQGRRPSPLLAAVVRDLLGEARVRVPDSIPPLVEWLGSTPERRGAALRDLLRLASRIPRSGSSPSLRFPRIDSTRGTRVA